MQTRTNEEIHSETNLSSVAFVLALSGVGLGIGMGIGGLTFMLTAATEHIKNKGMICAISGFAEAGVSASLYGLFRCYKKINAEKHVTESFDLYACPKKQYGGIQ